MDGEKRRKAVVAAKAKLSMKEWFCLFANRGIAWLIPPPKMAGGDMNPDKFDTLIQISNIQVEARNIVLEPDATVGFVVIDTRTALRRASTSSSLKYSTMVCALVSDYAPSNVKLLPDDNHLNNTHLKSFCCLANSQDIFASILANNLKKSGEQAYLLHKPLASISDDSSIARSKPISPRHSTSTTFNILPRKLRSCSIASPRRILSSDKQIL